MTVLREALLEGRAVALGGSCDPGLAPALAALGARVEEVPALDGADEERVGEWARSRAPLQALIYVESGLEDLLAGAWAAVREVATGALIESGVGGKIVLVAPGRAHAVAAGLENLARTLSVEWARYGVTVVAVAPGPHASDEQLAELLCYLVSPAGDYFSGCRFDVGLVARGS